MDFSGLDSLIAPIAKAFAKEKICRFKPLPFAAAALLAIEMKRLLNRPIVLITESATLMEEMRRNLSAFTQESDETIFDYPPLENIADGKQPDIDPATAGERLRALAHVCSHSRPFLLNTCVQALMQKTVSPASIKKNSLPLSSGQEYDPDRLAAWLAQAGYEFVPEVQERGQTVRRGGLMDVWPFSEPAPFRLEFNGLKIESIRRFDSVDQRSFAKTRRITLPPVKDPGFRRRPPEREAPRDARDYGGLVLRSEGLLRRVAQVAGGPGSADLTMAGHDSFNSLASYLPAETIFFWTEKYYSAPAKGARQYAGIGYHAELCEKAAADSGRSNFAVSFRELTETILERNNCQCFSVVEFFLPVDLPLIELGFQPVWDIGSPSSRDAGARDSTLRQNAARLRRPDYAGAPASPNERGELRSGESATPRRARWRVGGGSCRGELQFSPQFFLTPDIAHENRRLLLALLEEKARGGMRVHFFFGTQGALDRFRDTAGKSHFHLHPGTISDGFLHDKLRLAVISESGLLLQTKTMRRRSEIRAQRLAKRRSMAGETITDWTNIEPGDLVVHVHHGIGKYLGLYEIVFNGKLQETFAVEYAERAKLYVPVSQAHLLSRYLTAGGRKAGIHRLGGSQWPREKQAAQNAIYDLAASLLETQALRETFAGFAFPTDTVWQHSFETAFPYEETEDQERAIIEVKADMESNTPMDRLVCGDAGYGKTEVALRAAFKAVMAGKQVVVLVPTTVLALQHYEVFQQRMENYPIRVELLCRFRSAAEQQNIVGELQKGTLDIVIGTHRLLQADIGFKDLGLIIIDEEQRFGVVHKERLKQLKKLADVLTLTATPIPRTLYMSLTGARKISMIQTPPKARLPIETIIVKNDDRLVREAILREINRGGQAFYLHNRVATINKIFARLKLIVPEARIAIAHGQMSSRELADKMHAFGQGLFDVLLCTTIVESGVDLPNVNTILIDRADRFGIADLYQLRGRVGRSDRKAYAYLLTPIHGYLLDVSRRRLQAIMEHSSLGSGFKLAMMDLEIRGTGNLLGTEQSGYIAAIGFDLYCQLLRRAIQSARNDSEAPRGKPRGIFAEPCGATDAIHPCGKPQGILAKKGKIENPPLMTAKMVDAEVNLDFISLAAENKDGNSSAFLPVDYVEDEQTRINIYRKVAAATPGEIESLRNEFRDRFGPLPKPFEYFLKIAAIRVMAARKNISAVEAKEGRIMFSRQGEYLHVKNQFPRLRAADADGKLEEIISRLGEINEAAFAGKANDCCLNS